MGPTQSNERCSGSESWSWSPAVRNTFVVMVVIGCEWVLVLGDLVDVAWRFESGWLLAPPAVALWDLASSWACGSV